MKLFSPGAFLAAALTVATSCPAQQPPKMSPLAARPGDFAPAARGEDVRDRILQGRALIDENDPRATGVLREAARDALASLASVAGPNVLEAAPGSLPGDVLTAGLAKKAAEAHLYWGLAADKFALRDEAITALARATRLARVAKGPTDDFGTLKRDSALELGRVLREGLPLVAPDDTLSSIASLAHGNLWTPRRFNFDFSALSTDAAPGTIQNAEFLVTSGKLFPPSPASAAGGASLARVPPLYQNVPVDRLPPSLQQGNWRQVVRVFYASPFLTRRRRDDAPRAESLCVQFLKIHALMRSQLGLSNLYARGDKIAGVTTLWLLEVSALWPEEDDDPLVIAQAGPKMPDPNTGGPAPILEVAPSPISRAWNAPIAGQTDTAPGDILFWKSGMGRSDAEWVRELAHEYGHVALPPFDAFRPPLEPYANGLLGETLGLLWAAALPTQFDDKAALTPLGAVASLPLPPGEERGTRPEGRIIPALNTNDADALTAGFTQHIERNALPALKLWDSEGPNSLLRSRGNREGARYLQGLTVYLERVYGARLLGRAFQPLAVRAAQTPDVMTRRTLITTQSLLDAIPTAWHDPWGGQKSLRIWLPGVLAPPDLDAQTLVARGTGRLHAGVRANGWLWVPPGTDSLRIEGRGIEAARVEGSVATTTAGAMRVNLAGRSGWQLLTLVPGTDAQITSAQFERR